MQQTGQQREQQTRLRGRPWLPGQSGNPLGRESASARRERYDRKVAEIAGEFGGFQALSVTEVELVRQAADLLMRRPVDVDQQVRITNAVTRIFATLGKRRGKREQHQESLKEYAARGARERAGNHADDAEHP